MTTKITTTIALVLLLAAWPLVGAAHTHLDRSEPAKDAVLGSAPEKVKLWFSGRIEPEFSKIEVTDAEGQRIDQGAPAAGNDGRDLEVTLANDLPPGTYQVKWNVIARDGHRVKGDFSFTIE